LSFIEKILKTCYNRITYVYTDRFLTINVNETLCHSGSWLAGKNEGTKRLVNSTGM